MKKLLNNLLLIIILLVIIYYFYLNRDILTALNQITIVNLVVLIVFQALMLSLMGISSWIMIRRINNQVGLSTIVFLQFINNAFNNILPQGGVGYRAIILNKKYNISYLNFIPVLAASFILNLIISCIFALICFYALFMGSGKFEPILIIFYLITLIVSIAVLIARPTLEEKDNKIIKAIRAIIEGWNVIREHPMDIYIILFLAIINLAFKAWQMSYLYQALGEYPNPYEMVYLSTITIMLQIINITPGSIGIREGVYAFSAQILSIPANMLVLGSLVQRAIQLITATFLGGVSYLIFSSYLKRDNDPKDIT